MTRHIEPAEIARVMNDARALYQQNNPEVYQRHWYDDDPRDIQDGAGLGFHIFMWGSWAVIALIFAALVFA